MTADVLLMSDLRGIESHGFARFVDFYVDRAHDDQLNVHPNVEIVAEAPATATIDGDGGLGFVPGTIGMKLAIEKARDAGVGMVSVRNSTHYGPCSPYAMMALDAGMIGIAMTTGGNNVAPPGAAQRVHGLNAMSFVAPCRDPQPAFCLDMATSVVAAGKIEIARRRDKPIPEGWAIDLDGSPITDPERFYEVLGAILPLGGDALHGVWKGFGLTLMVDVLTGVLTGGKGSSELPRRAANHFCAAMRIDAFTDHETFYDQMDSMMLTLRTGAASARRRSLDLPRRAGGGEGGQLPPPWHPVPPVGAGRHA